jgi:acyl-CoA oxidase
MLQGRYKVPASLDQKSLLAKHELGLFEECRAILASLPHHRSPDVNRLILPQCQGLIEAMGHRMAYDAAVAAGVRQELVDLYVASCVKLDQAWYIENAGLTRKAVQDMEATALDAVLPQLGQLVGAMGVEPWITAKIVSDERWAAFVQTCETFEGSGAFAVFAGEAEQQIARSHL